MTDSPGHRFLNKRVLLWSLALLLLLVLWPSTLRQFFGNADEISFAAGFDLTTCSGFLANESIDSQRCRANYRVVLGNTGSNLQEHIQIVLVPVPETWRLSVNVTDIVASAKTRTQPLITHQQNGTTLTINIDNLQANRMVTLQLQTIGKEAAELLATTSVQVSANGTMVKSDPQLTVVARFLGSLFSLFGF